jgi:hypothetical protein
MSIYINSRPRVAQNICAYIKRSIVGSGKLTVKKGDEVNPSDILGRYIFSSGFASVDLAKKLGVSPKEVGKYLKRQIGSTIFKGELLAEKSGMFSKKVVISPTDGVVEDLSKETGQLRIRFISKQISLTSGVYGIVESANQTTGEILIKTCVTEIYGLLGSGKERGGVLKVLKSGGELTNDSDINASFSNHILLCGGLVYSSAIKKAIGVGVSGIITGGINAKDYRAITGGLDKITIGSDVGTSLIATEGYGPISMGEDIRSVLSSYEDKFIFVSGNNKKILLPSATADSIPILRKTAIPLQKTFTSMPEVWTGELKVGASVRIVWPPFMGLQGKVIALDNTPTLLESGIKTLLVTVESATRKVKVPYTNIELIV